MSKESAKNITLALGLRKKRQVVSPSKRKTKDRETSRKLCLICSLPFVKLEDHLQFKHKLPRNKAIEEAKSSPDAIVSDEEYFSCCSDSESDDIDSTDDEENNFLLNFYIRELQRNGGIMQDLELDNTKDNCDDLPHYFNSNSDEEDEDWLELQFQSLLGDASLSMSDAIRQKLAQDDNNEKGKDDKHEGDSEFDDGDDDDADRDADLDEDVDFEPTVFTSPDEEKLLKGFVDFLTSRDGGKKSHRDAVKHKSTVMRTARSDRSGTAYYEKLLQYDFLLGFVSILENENKLPGTVKTYLGSIQHFFHYLKLSVPKGFDLTQIDPMELRVVKWKCALGRDIKRHQSKKNY